MKYRWLDCVQIRYNCLLLIPEYYQKSHLDTVLYLLDYWEENCQTNVLINRTLLLLAIQQGHFDERIYDHRIIYYLLDYKDQFELTQVKTEKGKTFASPLDSAQAVFDSFTVYLAEKAYQCSAKNTIEQLLAEHFMGEFDSTFLKLQSIIYNRSDLQRYYWQEVNAVINSNYFYYGLSGGIWMPQSKGIRGLGNHPEIGFYSGLANHQRDINLYLFLRFASTSEPYSFSYRGQSFTSQKFLDGGAGLEWGSKFWFRMHSEMTLHTGFGVDSYSPPDADQVYSDKSISYFYFSPGFSFGWRPEKLGRTQFSLQGRYYIFLADLGELKGPRGNSLCLRFVLSYNLEDFRKQNLKRLSYKY